MKGQIDYFDEIIVDNFAGGGGASTGIELATGRPVAIAINHDPAAILMHRTNHPYTEHIQASVWDVDPAEVCRGRPVGLAWFSPDCKHFSKAKGSALVDRNIRGLAWIVLRWAATVRPRVIILENVEEFQTWGPVRKGRPIRKKACQTFRQWKTQLLNLGYAVEHRELVAADYGAPTSRKRFVLVARCDGRPIVWPERTHAPADSPEVKSGRCKPWRSAAEIIDWSIQCPSIFATKEEIKAKYGVKAVRPLAEATQRRAIRGVDKFTIRSGKPFLVPTGYGERNGQAPRVHDIDKPLPTVVSTGKQNLCQPVLQQFSHHPSPGLRETPGDTFPRGGRLTGANLLQYHAEQHESARVNSLDAALPTVDASNRYALTAAHLTEYYGNGQPISIGDPMHTVTSHDRDALTTAVLQPIHAGGYHGKGNLPTAPVNTVTSSGGQSLVTAHIAEIKGQNRGQSAEQPLRTITAGGGEFGAVRVTVTRYEAEDGTDSGRFVNRPYGYWPEIRALLNKHCGYQLAEDEILLLSIGGVWYFLSDIGLRMLMPKELYAAMGFPPDYIIDRDYTGKPYPKTEQVARCGNAVCPPMATAVVRSNLPEWCGEPIEKMEEFTRRVAI